MPITANVYYVTTQRSKIKVTQSRRQIWRPGRGIITISTDPFRSSRSSSFLRRHGIIFYYVC